MSGSYTHESEIFQPRAANLPSNALQKILLALHEEEDTTTGHGFHAAWVAVSKVCRHWRDTALATSALWRNVDISCRNRAPEAIATQLARTGGRTDITVSIDTHAMADIEGACEAVAPYAARCECLSVSFGEDDPAHVAAVGALLQHLGPALKELLIFNTLVVQEALEMTSPLMLNAAQVPGLRTLQLHGTCVHVEGTLRGLEDLILSAFVDADEEYVYDLLPKCPDLTFLSFEDMVAEIDSTHGPSYTLKSTLQFPRLKRLYIDEHATGIPELLGRLALPEGAVVEITARYDEGDVETEHGEKLLNILPLDVFPRNHLAALPAFAAASTLELRFGARDGLPDLSVSGVQWDYVVPHLPLAHALTGHVLRAFPALVDAAQLVFLDVHIAQDVPVADTDAWVAMLQACSNIAGITVGGYEAFAEMVGALVDGGELLPRLIQMTACIVVPSESNVSQEAKAFGKWLGLRKERGRGLKSVIVRVPGPFKALNEATIKFASALVGYVDLRGWKPRVERIKCVTCHT